MDSMKKHYLLSPGKLVCLVFIILALVAMMGCSLNQIIPSSTTSFVEPPVPANYHTYSDETSAFSISYPPEWEEAQSMLEQLDQTSKDVLKNLNSDLPIDKVSIIFFAGLPVEGGYYPNVNIALEPLPFGVRNQDQLADAEMLGIKNSIPDFEEFSRTKTKINSIDASIIEYSCTFPNSPKAHNLVMCLYKGKICWTATCWCLPEDFDQWKGDFQSIVRSLRILK
jgi:hypothetical protein